MSNQTMPGTSLLLRLGGWLVLLMLLPVHRPGAGRRADGLGGSCCAVAARWPADHGLKRSAYSNHAAPLLLLK